MESANWRSYWQKLVSRAWVPVLVIAVVLVVRQSFLILPEWLEQKVTRTLREEEVVVASFPVEQIGFSQTSIGKGSVLYKENSVSWDAIHVKYKASELILGQVGHIEVDLPVVSVNLSLSEMKGASDPVEESDGGLFDFRVDYIDPKPVVLDGVEIEQVEEPATNLMALSEPVPVEKVSLWESLQNLPFSSLAARNGVLDIQLQDIQQFTAEFGGRMDHQPFGLFGEWMLDSSEISMHLTLRAPADDRVVTLQGESAMPVGAVRTLGNQYISLLENCDAYPTITHSGQFVMDILAENREGQEFYGSAEVSMDEFVFRLPGTQMEVGLSELVLAGYFKENTISMEGGTEVLMPVEKDFRVEPFGLRFSLKDSTRFSLETEVIDLRAGDLNGRFAVLGNGNLDRYPEIGWARIETSFSQLKHQQISMDPFSVLLSPGTEQIAFEASPIGLNQFGTIWIENISGEIASDMTNGRGNFTLYGLMGEELGTAGLMFLENPEFSQVNFSLLDTPGEAGLQGSLRKTGKASNIELSGKVLPTWINSVARWFGISSYSLDGAYPEIEANLRWFKPIMTGNAKLVLDGMDLSIDDGTQMKGISGDIDLSVMVMPSTPEKQVLRIEKLINGPIEMHDIVIEWQLKHIRELRISRFTGKIGEGIIELEPFSIDPFNPEVKTAILIREFDADLLRQWLKEERFSIEGFIAGKIPVGWKNGEVLIGSGSFDLDTQFFNGRLKFEDEAFLRDKFASIGGIPVDLKERLLNALWENGIQMNRMEIYLGPTARENELSFRIAVNGETGNDLLEFPIGEFVLNNLISLSDLAVLMNMVAPIRIDPDLGK